MAKRHPLFIFLCLVIILPGCSLIYEQSLDQPGLEERIDDLFTRYTDSGVFSGAVLIASGDQFLFRRGYGLADREEQILNNADTQFSLQSISKLFTYAAVMMEVNAGRVSLDDPIESYLPGFPNGDRITIDHLLHHSSGLLHYPHEVPDHIHGSLTTPITLDVLIEELKGFPLKFEPGTQFGYSNAGYSVLARVIEIVSGTTFGDYLENNIFTPTRMNHTTADWDSVSQDLAIGYEEVAGEYIRSPSDHPSHYVGAGTCYSTVDDMYRWYKAIYVDGSMSEFSLGGGNGRGMGYRTVFWPIPSFDIVIIILSNNMDAPVDELVSEVAAILLEDTPFINQDLIDLEALRGQYVANSGFGEFSFTIYGSPDALFVSVTDFAGESLIYELRPISPHQFAFLMEGRLTGQTLTFMNEGDAIAREVLVDLSVLQLEAIRSE
jgi:CubicO group peptidase (beta-lactamase class C family)